MKSITIAICLLMIVAGVDFFVSMTSSVWRVPVLFCVCTILSIVLHIVSRDLDKETSRQGHGPPNVLPAGHPVRESDKLPAKPAPTLSKGSIHSIAARNRHLNPEDVAIDYRHDVVQRLKALEGLYAKGRVTKEQFERRKNHLVSIGRQLDGEADLNTKAIFLHGRTQAP